MTSGSGAHAGRCLNTVASTGVRSGVRTIALLGHTKKHPLPARVLEAIGEALTIHVLCAPVFAAPLITDDEDGFPRRPRRRCGGLGGSSDDQQG
jgi:hypothetical protein